MGKTPLELASSETVRELIIAYSNPKYMPDDQEINTELKKLRKHDTRVTKQGHIYRTAEYDMEQPLRQPLKRPKSKSKRVRVKVEEPIPEEKVEIKDDNT
jgi:hypothetical protein